jgi:hypothetical protein
MAWKWPLMGLVALFVLDGYIIISVTFSGSACPELTVIFIASLFVMMICIGWFFCALGHPKCKNARIRIKDPRIKGFNKTCIYHAGSGWRGCSVVDSEDAADTSCIEESMVEDDSSSSSTADSLIRTGSGEIIEEHDNAPVIIEVE